MPAAAWGEHCAASALRLCALRSRRAEEAARAPPNGNAFTSSGPPVLPPGKHILDDPDLLWAEEEDWTNEKDEQLRLIEQGKRGYVTPFRRKKLHEGTVKNWDAFYKRNGTRFFKNRHYLHVVFSELDETENDRVVAKELGSNYPFQRATRRTLLELGCGVGNAVFPLLETNAGLYVVAVDLSIRAIDALKENPLYTSLCRCAGYACDATQEDLPSEAVSMDFVLLQFSISAVLPADQEIFARRAADALRPGGLLLIRDYGRHDEAQLRFPGEQRLSDHCYARCDGTIAYFFTLEELRHLFVTIAGLEECECFYVRRQYANRADKSARRRVWVHAKFRKPQKAAIAGVSLS